MILDHSAYSNNHGLLAVRNLTKIALLICVAPPLVAHAAFDSTIGVSTALEYHSNINQTSENEMSEVERQIGAKVGLSQESNFSQMNIDYDVTKRDFQHDRQEDTTSTTGSARINVDISPKRLAWFASNSLSEDLRDSRAADTQDNRERRSSTATGVQLTARFSARDYLQLTPSVSKVQFKDSSQSDSERTNANLSWLHGMSQVSNLRFSIAGSKVKFDNTDFDYDYSAINAGYTTQLSRIKYSLTIGANKVNRDIGNDVDGVTLNATANFSASPTFWGLSLLSEITDSSVGFSSFETEISDFESDDNNFESVDIIKRSQFQAFYRSNLSSNSSIGARTTINEERYDTLPEDQLAVSISANYTFRYTQRLSFSPGIAWKETKYRDDPLDEKRKLQQVNFTINYVFLNDLSTALRLASRKQRSTAYSDQDFDDNIARLSLSYQFR